MGLVFKTFILWTYEGVGLKKTRITAQSIFFNLRKVDNSNKWKNYVIVTRVKLNVKLDALVVR